MLMDMELLAQQSNSPVAPVPLRLHVGMAALPGDECIGVSLVVQGT